jgi:outer membrane protein TolC
MRWVCLLLILAGCKTVGPDYEKPKTETKLPGDFSGPDDPALQPGTEDLEKWWEVFQDPQLADLIQRAAKQNLDVRIAIARVNESRARVDIASAARSPQVGLGGGGGAAAFGGNAMVTLYAEVARNYLAIRTYQERLRAALKNIEAQRDILRITRGRYDAGLSSRLDVAQAERVLANSESEVPPLRIQLVRSANTIGVLLGQFPKDLREELSTEKPIPVPPETVSVGVPANLVRQRPDIRGAERRLAAQTARIGVATADLYPQFSLGGSLGVGNLGAGGVLGPSMRWTLFDGGRIRSQIKVEDYRVEQAMLTYESTVLQALEEVESAMTAFLESRVRAEAVGRAAGIAREELRLGMYLYKAGLVGFQNVLDAERALFNLENRAADTRGAATANLVRLYKALGGGWDPDKAAKPDPKKLDEQPDAKRTLEEGT